MPEIRQILYQDSRHKFELVTRKSSLGPQLTSSLVHKRITPGDPTQEFSTFKDTKRLGTVNGKRATQANLDSLHKGSLDIARRIVEQYQDDPQAFALRKGD